MKKLLFLILGLLFIRIASADTVNIDWLVDGQTYTQTSCTVGGDIILPTAPTKRGHTFLGWKLFYTPIEYIESTGTQYIDTGYKPNNRTVLKGKGYWKAMSGGLIVARWSGAPTKDTFGVYMAGDSLVFYNGKYSDGKIIQVKNIPFLNTVYEYEMLLDRVVYNNTTVNMTRDTFQSSYSLFIGAYNNMGRTTDFYNGRIYQQTIIEDGTVIHDFIPVLDLNGVPCMFDKVSRTFFYNSGTGNFIAGPVITE